MSDTNVREIPIEELMRNNPEAFRFGDSLPQISPLQSLQSTLEAQTGEPIPIRGKFYLSPPKMKQRKAVLRYFKNLQMELQTKMKDEGESNAFDLLLLEAESLTQLMLQLIVVEHSEQYLTPTIEQIDEEFTEDEMKILLETATGIKLRTD